MRSLLVIALALIATPAFAQQFPSRQIAPSDPILSENYRGQPFIFDLLLRAEPSKEGERARFLKEEHQAICLAEMNDSLRTEGLTNKARQVYGACVDRLSEAERNGETIPAPPPRSLLVPLTGRAVQEPLSKPAPPPCEPPPVANKPTRPNPCPAAR